MKNSFEIKAKQIAASALLVCDEHGADKVLLAAFIKNHGSEIKAAGSELSKFGCLMVMLPELEKLIREWAKRSIAEDTLVDDGIEQEPHVTALYGFNKDFDVARLATILEIIPSIELTLGKISRFECEEYDVIKIEVESADLVKLNALLATCFTDTITPSKWSYHPHLTIAYVAKGTNLSLTNGEDDRNGLEGRSFKVNELLYSLPQKQGRQVLKLAPSNRGDGAVESAMKVIPFNPERHNEIRNRAAVIYQDAVNRFVAVAEAAARKKKNEDEWEEIFGTWAETFELAAEKAFATTAPSLASEVNTVWIPEPKDMEAYATARKQFVEQFPRRVMERLEKVAQSNPEATEKQKRQKIHVESEAIKEGAGRVVAETEAQVTYGTAQIEVLKKAGYRQKLWMTMDDDKVRESHSLCEEQGAIGIYQTFHNGLHFPGDENGGPEEIINCRCVLAGFNRQPIQAGAHYDPIEKRDNTGKWTTGGIGLKRVGEGKEAKWKTEQGEEIPGHLAKLGIPPAWTKVQGAKSAEHDLQAVGYDTKGREQRIYSDAFTARMAQMKFDRNKELLQKQGYIFKQNEDNLTHKDEKIREAAACMKLIQQTGIRPGSDTDTGAEKQAYGATTLLGKHVVVSGTLQKVTLEFTGKKGVALKIPVEDEATAKMLIARKEAAGDDEKLFNTDDTKLRDYSHTLNGGSFKPKDFRTLKGTQTAIAEIDSNPERAKDAKEYKKRVMAIAKRVSEVLGNTPTIALQSYINPFVFQRIQPA